jgi:hypothetical protein
MKNLCFHLMPYKDLPADFRQAHASVWVDIDSNLLDGQRVHEHYHEYLDELEFAGEVGFDGIWASTSRVRWKRRRDFFCRWATPASKSASTGSTTHITRAWR